MFWKCFYMQKSELYSYDLKWNEQFLLNAGM